MTDLAPEQRCLDCSGQGGQLGHTCTRCSGTGRRHYLRLVIDPSPDNPGRCHLQWWWGAGYAQALIADSQLRGDVSDVTADEVLAAITDPGIAIDDRRRR